MSVPSAVARLRDELRTRIQRVVRYRGALVIVLWQLPLGPGVGPDGRISLLFGSGLDELAELNCAGDLLEARSISYRTAALEADYDLSANWRLEAGGGFLSSAEPSHAGLFGAGRLRGDWRYFGLGGGFAYVPHEYGSSAAASGYLRVGSAETLHLRTDLFPPSPLLAQQLFRLGLGYNATRRDLPSGFLGVAALGVDWWDTGGIGVAGEFALPIRDQFGIRLNGHYSRGQRHSITGVAVGASYLLR